MSDFSTAAEKSAAHFDMLIEMFPQHREQFLTAQQEQYQKVAAILQPLQDFLEGKITRDEYDAIAVKRHVARQAESLDYYGPSLNGASYKLECSECGAEQEWFADDHDGDLPPIYFTCEDVTGEPCTTDDT